MRWLFVVMVAVLAWNSEAVAGNDDIAVIIGNRTYQGSVPPVEYAHRDAEAMLRLFRDDLGYRHENIIDLRDASLSQMTAVFGSDRSAEGQLFNWTKPGKSTVVVYYSGHGVPDPRDKRGYLLPADANPNAPQLTGYPLDLLLANLAKLPARSITVYLDACFSGDTPKGGLVQNVSAFGTGIELPKPKPNVTVVTAASGVQRANWDEQAGHGLFTEHLLRALYGSGTMTAKGLKAYLDEEMTYAARRKGLPQAAEVQGANDTVLVSWPGGKAPTRPALSGVRVAAVTPAPPPPPVVAPAQPAAVSPPVAPSSSSRSPGSVFRDCADCPEMVVVPAGSFMMGSVATETGRFDDEGPQHRVMISRSFAVGKYAVTQAEWQSVMESNPSQFKGSRNPVEQVSWNDAQEFIRRLNAKLRSVVQVSTGGDGPYRLLTEAEWEYAARAGTTTKYPWGDGIGSGNANCDGCGSQWDNKSTAPVGSFRPNAFGLYDMHGNVWQWVQDCKVDSYAGAPMDGSKAQETNSLYRVIRGGSWLYDPRFLRSAVRRTYTFDSQLANLGFRLARTLP